MPGELGELARAMENMRSRLEGRDYIEGYVRALTHELKSPVAAIRGAGELLQEDLPAADRELFARQVVDQCQRLQNLVDQLLRLSQLEQRRALVQEDLAHHEEGIASAAERRIPEQYILEITRQRMLLQADLDWLDQLLPRLGDPAFAWGADPDHCLAERKAHE